MKYTPALDGLRAVAILLVMLFHAHGPIATGGFVGVDVFFVLSGFLITSLLLAERDATGTVSLRAFYWRRVVRLTPALFAMLGVYLALAPLLWPGVAHGLHVTIAALYLADYAQAFWSVPVFLGHTWSLSVEEHFYVLWPLVLLLARRRWSTRQLAITLGAAYILTTLWRVGWVVDGQSWQEVYFRFDTRLSGLLLGACLAALTREAELLATVRRYMPAAVWWLPVAALAIARFQWGNSDVLAWGLAVVELATFALLLSIHTQPTGRIPRTLAHPAFVWLGKISYGTYLWHYPIFRAMGEIGWPWWLVLLAGVPVAITCAAVSFYTVESGATRLARSLRYRSSMA